ncbi:MAG TPA: phosphoenolpyruvate carboxykinase (ATP), partial [Terriglobales bacterium]
MSTAIQPSLAELLHHGKVHRNLNAAPLVEIAIRRGEARLASNGGLVAYTGRTGRSPKDKFTVKDELTADRVHWGAINQPFERERFDALYDRVVEHLRDRELFVQ